MHDSLIMFGGSSVGKEYSFGDINKFDVKKKAWTKLEALGKQPPPREAHIAHALGHDDVFREREPLRRRVRLLMDEGRETRSLAHSFPSRTQGSRREGE